MGGVLVLIALIGLIVWVFATLFRRRVQSRLQAAGHELPEELRQLKATAAPAPRAVAPAAGARLTVMPSTPARTLPAGGLHFMLIYDVGPDFIQRRAQYREQHLALAWKAAAAGELLLAGALEEPTDQAFLLFRGSRDAARRFAEADPYVTHGLVKQWRVRQWHTVAGESAAMPVRPQVGPGRQGEVT